MEKSIPPFKATYDDLKQSTLGFVDVRNNIIICINTEYLNPLRREGYARISFRVEDKKYQRLFKTTVADKYLINFINKFVNDEDYRTKFEVPS